MRGRRLKISDGDPPWSLLEQAGDYVGPVKGFTGDAPAVFYLLPIARDKDSHGGARAIHHVCSPPHVFTENADGTLTIAASIGNPHWHGFLENGIWRKCE